MTNLLKYKRQRAFTLIELLVVILIIAILIAVAAPSFLGQQDKAKDSGTKQTLAVVYKAVKADTIRENNNGFLFRADPADVRAAVVASEPQLADSYDIALLTGSNIPAQGRTATCDNSDANTTNIVSTSGSGQSFLMKATSDGSYDVIEGDCTTVISAAADWFSTSELKLKAIYAAADDYYTVNGNFVGVTWNSLQAAYPSLSSITNPVCLTAEMNASDYNDHCFPETSTIPDTIGVQLGDPDDEPDTIGMVIWKEPNPAGGDGNEMLTGVRQGGVHQGAHIVFGPSGPLSVTPWTFIS